MLVGWLAHRSFTFALPVPPSLAEFLRYTAVGWSVADRQLWPVRRHPFVVACRRTVGCRCFLLRWMATLFAYFGMRYAAFRVHRG